MSTSNWMTEKEARKKWCPEARVAASNTRASEVDEGKEIALLSNAPAHNRFALRDTAGTSTHASSNCMASLCAMWVWEEDEAGNFSMTYGGCGLRRLP